MKGTCAARLPGKLHYTPIVIRADIKWSCQAKQDFGNPVSEITQV